jgi:hypothetical protein
MLADRVDFVIGVDTHRDTHALAVVGSPSGGVVLVEPRLEACPRGYRRALALARVARSRHPRLRGRGHGLLRSRARPPHLSRTRADGYGRFTLIEASVAQGSVGSSRKNLVQHGFDVRRDSV